MTLQLITGLAIFLSSSYCTIAHSQETRRGVSEQTGQKVFAKILPYAFKVKTSPSADSPQASYGTGFIVDRDGLLITNYHVVSQSIIEPKTNKIFVIIDDKPVAGLVLAVDVVHDLALIRVDKVFPGALTFAGSKPKQGEPIYSIGQPENLNMSIALGTYNNELDYGKYSVIHLSAPINGGMSGGPTVNQNGELIGVNVSKLVFASNVSFAVPARFAQVLYQKNKSLRDHPQSFWPEMEQQLTELQESLTQDILKNTQTKTFHAWNVPQMPQALKCWSRSDQHNESKEFYKSLGENCNLEHSAYLSGEAASGTYSFSLTSYENKKMNSWQFYRLLSTENQGTAFGRSWKFSDKPAMTTEGACTSKVVVNKSGLPVKVGYCARAYVHFPTLQDARIVAKSVDGPPNAIAIDLHLYGFTRENIKKITQKFIENTSKGKL